MADDDDGDDELDTIWNPAAAKASPQPRKPLELVVAHGKQAYSAFTVKDKVRGFVVKCVNQHKVFYYPHLLTVTLNQPHDDSFTLTTTTAVIQVWGMNLSLLLPAFLLQTCETITEYSAALFLLPGDKTAPFIEQIHMILSTPTEKPERVAKPEEKPEEQEA